MTIDVTDNLGKSFQYAKDNLVGKWITYVVLFVCALIPLVNLLTLPGFAVRVFRNKFAIGDWVELVIDSVKALIIAVVYLIIPAVVAAVFGVLFGAENIVTIVVSFVVSLLFVLLLIIALIRFAKGSFGDAFQLGAVFTKIASIGWLSYLIAVLVAYIIMWVLGAVCGFLGGIGWLIMALLTPFVLIGFARYYANVYESA
ncbi:DUF4013 domain-containing protein [Methanocorpusculum sp. MG]|uniref:DUF4013 domain-containing protein n=1 Tax=Methanocorpusculum petauri TaxID=3002863 RepID=A0ABT4ID20_9EURY|nr:DUF4013 domain-containing protein [Methanocorpusculum petauri]MCZ0859645.1 DUF4013 domain-containing protein [Methanocorpusculum petauri]